jgi:hypothetical protein
LQLCNRHPDMYTVYRDNIIQYHHNKREELDDSLSRCRDDDERSGKRFAQMMWPCPCAVSTETNDGANSVRHVTRMHICTCSCVTRSSHSCLLVTDMRGGTHSSHLTSTSGCVPKTNKGQLLSTTKVNNLPIVTAVAPNSPAE